MYPRSISHLPVITAIITAMSEAEVTEQSEQCVSSSHAERLYNIIAMTNNSDNNMPILQES